jgi:hypothetical protein
MRGLEPPPDFSDTDLNRGQGLQMRTRASRSSVLWGFTDGSDASDDVTVVKLLSRHVNRMMSAALYAWGGQWWRRERDLPLFLFDGVRAPQQG